MSRLTLPGIFKKPFWKWLLSGILFLLIYFLLVNHAENNHQYEFGDWKSEIYADKSGYYIYLPATFIYGFHQAPYPDSIDFKLGNGFGFVNGKMFTKYTYGVALLTTPFFLTTHLARVSKDLEANGFSSEYLNFTYYASVFYLLAGLWALLTFLRRRFSLYASILTIVLLAFATNLYYYTFQEALMSHVYSFALFSFMLLLTDNYWKKQNRWTLAGIAFASALIVLIRPTNAIVLFVVLLLDVKMASQLKERLRILLSVGNALILSGLFLLLWIPQMAYWKFMSGSFLFYSYKGEGFTNWLNPQILEVLFAPKNGLFIYVPAFVLVIAGLILMIFRKDTNRWLVGAIFIVQLYLVSSWHMFFFGCSFGQRSFVEFLALFSIPLATLFNLSFRPVKIIFTIFIVLISGYLIFFNLRLSATYARCFDAKAWEWEIFRHHLVRAKVFPLPENTFSWKNDFEMANTYSTAGININKVNNAFSGIRVNALKGNSRFSDGFEIDLSELSQGKIFTVTTSMQFFFNKFPEDASFVCSVVKNDTTVFFESKRLPMDNETPLKNWNRIEVTFEIPFLKPEGKLRAYLMTSKTEDLLIDDFEVKICSEK